MLCWSHKYSTDTCIYGRAIAIAKAKSCEALYIVQIKQIR